jgi:hypothetical protein
MSPPPSGLKNKRNQHEASGKKSNQSSSETSVDFQQTTRRHIPIKSIHIKVNLREIGWGGMDWIHLAQDRDLWRAVVNTVMNIWVP